MKAEEFKTRTKLFALSIINLVEKLPKNKAADIIGKQVIRSASSVGANYRASCRAKSKADFIAKMGIVEEEADETIYWMELLFESGLISEPQFSTIKNEGKQILAIVVSSIKTAKSNRP